MLTRLILAFILCIIGVSSYAQDSEMLKDDNILEKYVDRINQRPCNANALTAYYKCSCKLSIHYPFFVKENVSDGLKKINQYISKYISNYRKNIGKCDADGSDFGDNNLSYLILYNDKKYISIGIEESFCCNELGEKHSYKIFNFDQTTGDLIDIDAFIDPSNLSLIEKYIMKEVQLYTDNLPAGFEVLSNVKDKNGYSKIKLASDYAQYYFTEKSIAIKVRPDVLGSNILDVKIPQNLVTARYYPIKVNDDELNDNANNILQKEQVTEEE